MVGRTLQLTSKYSGLSKNDIMSHKRNEGIVDAKQTVAIVLRKHGMNLQDIATNLNYKSHTSVMNLLNDRRIRNETLLSNVLGSIERKKHHSNNLTTLINQ